MTHQSFCDRFEEVLSVNLRGEVRNLLIADDKQTFLDDAYNSLCKWMRDKAFHLVELDEVQDGWLPEIQSRELFEKLNQPNAVLLIRNYATPNWFGAGENVPHNFLYDAALNRHYGCGNDFVPSDELPNLLFVVAINRLDVMYWSSYESSQFTVLHENDDQRVWIDTRKRPGGSKFFSVMSRTNKELYRVSEDRKMLVFNLGYACKPHNPRYAKADKIVEYAHQYLMENRPDFSDTVECLILRGRRGWECAPIPLDAKKLLAVLPNLKTVLREDRIELKNAENQLCVLDPFEVGELSFLLAQEGDSDAANKNLENIGALDRKCAEFWEKVHKDYYRKPEDHPKFDPNGRMVYDGMDDLFKVYLLGWYSLGFPIETVSKVYVEKHKNFEKAIGLLPVRFQNCDLHEVGEKLYWDLQYVEDEDVPDYDSFAKVLAKAELLFPGVLDQILRDNWIDEDKRDELREMMTKATTEN